MRYLWLVVWSGCGVLGGGNAGESDDEGEAALPYCERADACAAEHGYGIDVSDCEDIRQQADRGADDAGCDDELARFRACEASEAVCDGGMFHLVLACQDEADDLLQCAGTDARDGRGAVAAISCELSNRCADMHGLVTEHFSDCIEEGTETLEIIGDLFECTPESMSLIACQLSSSSCIDGEYGPDEGSCEAERGLAEQCNPFL